MSQIIEKMQEGGMFKYPSGEIETERLVRAINGNMDQYLKSQNWTRKRKQRFLNSVDKFITGIQEGNIYEMTNNGTFYDKKGTISDYTGTKFFKEDKEAATFIKWVLDSQDPYVKKEEVIEKPKEANFDQAFAKTLNKKLFNIDSDELNLLQLENISDQYRSKYRKLLFETILPDLEMENWGKYQNKDNYINQVKEANNRLGQKHKKGQLTPDDIKRELSGLNINPYFIDSLFSAAAKKINNNNNNSNSVKEDPLKSYLYSNDVQRWWNQNKDKSLTLPNIKMGQNLFEKSLQYKNLNLDEYVERFLSNLSNLNYSGYNNFVSNDFKLPTFNSNGWNYENTTYAQLTSDILNYLITTGNNKYITPIDNGNGYAILPTLSVKSKGNGLITVYNPTNKKLIQIPAYFLINDPKVGELIRQQLRPEPKPDLDVPSIPWNKEGGVLKYQFGGTSDYFMNQFKEIIDNNINKHNNIFDKVTWDYDKRYRHTKKDSKSQLELIERTNKDITTDEISTGNGYYDPEKYGDEVIKQNWWDTWKNQLTSNKELAEKWARKYIEFNPVTGDKFKGNWFDKNNNFLFDKFKQDSNLWSNNQNGPGHDVQKGYVWQLGNEFLNDADLESRKIDKNDYDIVESDYPDLPLIKVRKLSLKNLNNSKENQNNSEEKKKESTATANTLNIDDFIKNNWSRWVVPALGSFYRFHNTSKANKDLLNESLNSIKPLYEDPKRFERNIYGDYASLSQHEENAARINTMSSKPLTSSGDLQAARLLEGEKAASQERALGQQANSNAIKQSTEQALAQAKQNMEWEVDAANSNRQRAWTSELLKSQAKQGYISKQAQNRDTFSKELEQFYQNYLDKKTEIGQSAISAYQQLMFTNNPELQAYTNKFKEMINAGQDYTTSPEYQKYLAKVNELAKQQIVFNVESLGNLYGINDFKSLNRLIPAIKFSKEGGTINRERIQKMKIKLEEQKLFQKSIIESIKENNKPINSLSNTMQKLLLKMFK